MASQDVEHGANTYRGSLDAERETLLQGDSKPDPLHKSPVRSIYAARFNILHLLWAFLGGLLGCFIIQYTAGSCFSTPIATASTPHNNDLHQLAPPYVGSTERHNFPPTSPTNAFPSLFPTNVGYAGGTPTGAEPGLVATAPAYPVHSGAAQLVKPDSLGGSRHGAVESPSAHSSAAPFDLFKSWGNLSPWYSVPRTAFGLDSDPGTPAGCRVTGLHFLHRHGARYPTAYASYGGPANFSSRLHDSAAKWNASGDLEFMNEWTYKLGEEILTPFGRQQLYDLGVSLRLKYGFLLKNFTEKNTIPVFRTESQDRMLSSAQNFALGFFAYPLEGKYQQSITIEADGFNNTLAPYDTCPNTNVPSKANRALPYVAKWAETYLKDAHARLAPQLHGYDMSIEDIYVLQQMCAYETVAIGYSKFCSLFTEKEWKGFDYSLDVYFWYNSAFGSPLARVQGIGYIQELVARLTHTPIALHNSSTNSTLDDDSRTFPLDQSLYVDASHEVVLLNVITALNLSNFAATGPLPSDHIPNKRSFKASELAPFASNIQFQLLACDNVAEEQIRIIINDGVAPLTGIKGCPSQADGMCPLSKFVAAQKEIIKATDWEWACHGDWDLPGGDNWQTTTGDAPTSKTR